MDFRKFAVEPISRLHFRDANDELMYADGDKSKPMAVNLYGPGSKQHARAASAQQNRMVDKLKRKGKTEQTADQKADDAAEFLAECTHSFENTERDGLKDEALAKAIYSDISIGFLAAQADKHIGDWANFTKALPKD